jgi:competence protein ComEC
MRRLSKYQSTFISFALIGAFLFVTGFSASIVRAAIVSGLSLLAWYYGRNFRPLLLILLTAAITGYWNPLYVWSDIGWYLSFLAFYGVLIVAPLLKRRLFGSREPRLLGMVAIESLSAQLMTTPFILWIFHQTSLVAPISNLLIVPLVPFAMLLSLIAGLMGMLVPVLAGWFSWPARLLLTYMLDMVTLFSRVPHALIRRSVSLPAMILLYGSAVVWIVTLSTKVKAKYGRITETETII